VGFLNPAIYAVAQSALYPSLFHDTTNGNNTNYNGSTKFYAKPGYDLCTGWGTPTGQALINALAPPDSLILLPRGGLGFAVANGYPLPIVSQTLALKDSGTNTIDWAFGAVPKWLSASISHGAINPGQAAFVTFASGDSATNLPPGEFVTNLLLTNLTAGVTHLIPVFLEVFDPLLITPDSGMTVIGPPGGPFNLSTQIYSLTNFASIPMDWTAQSSSPYVDLSPASGTLQPGDSTNVIATLDASASNVLISAESGNLLFTDMNTSNTQSLPFMFTVGNGGFESGDFSDWTFDGGSYPTNYVGAVAIGVVDYIHSGAFGALLGEPYTTATLSQTLPTVPGQLYEVSFFLNNPVGGAGPVGGGPANQIQVLWGGSNIFSEVNVPILQWTEMASAVFATNTATTLEFVFLNYPDYFGLDDISVTPAAPTAFSSASYTNNSFFFSWNAIPGASYQLQYSTDLVTWGKAGFPIPATNTIMKAKETLSHSQKQEYYRLFLITK
jgi:hypothetical protein